MAPDFIQLHLIIVEGIAEDFSFYKLHVPDAATMDALPEDVFYGEFERDSLRYWGPYKQPDISKVISFCHFDNTINVIF